MRTIETALLQQLKSMMQAQGKSQSDFASYKGISRQAVSPYFVGKKSLLTETGKDLLDFLGVTIRLVPKDSD